MGLTSAKPVGWTEEEYCSYPLPLELSDNGWTSLFGGANTAPGAKPPGRNDKYYQYTKKICTDLGL